MSFIPKPHEIYKHFKGNLYQIVAIAEHSETGEKLVIYQALYGDFKIYARPIEMFTGLVDKIKYPDVTQEFRFELQGADADRQRKETAVQRKETATWQKEDSALQAGTATQEAANVQNAVIIQKTASIQDTSPLQNSATGEEVSDEEPNLDPLVLEFLDADNYEERLNILAALHHRITDEMITTMAIACDIEVDNGDTEERYESLKGCLLTLEKYECNRLR